MSADDVKTLIETIAAEADATAELPMPEGAAGTRPTKSVPVAVRLAPTDVAAIEALAERLDVPMSSLLRGWILAALATNNEQTIATALDRLTADVQRLREIVA
jgi:hypothetical protein